MASDTHRAIDAVWRIESARLIAGLARMVKDVGLAEDLAQDALVAALERWPVSGVPDNPGAWLMATAKHRAIDLLRRRTMHERKEDEIGRELGDWLERAQPDLDAAIDDDVGDDLLRLVFTACHPVLSMEARVALTRILAGLAPDEPEVHGLVSLMEIQASRLGARVGPTGEPILLLDQDRGRWDHLLVRRGLAALYDALSQISPSPIVELNRSVALAMAFGPETGLEAVDALTSDPSLAGYHLLPAVRGDLLAKLGRTDEARTEFMRAASLTRNARERNLLLARAASGQ